MEDINTPIPEAPAPETPSPETPSPETRSKTDNQDSAASTAPAEPQSRNGRWTRSRNERILAGVAAGVAQRAQLPMWFVRAAFVVTSFAGGLGVAAYIAAWALMPEEGADRAPADGWRQRFEQADSPSKKAGIGLVVLGALIGIASTGFLASPLVLAALLVAAGVAMIRPSTT